MCVENGYQVYVEVLRISTKMFPSCPISPVYGETGLDLISCLGLKGGLVGFLPITFTDLNPKSNTLSVTLTN